MNSWKIDLTTARGLRTAAIEPMDNNGLMQYIVTVEDYMEIAFEPGWFAVFEEDAGRFRQSPESVERGPALSPVMMEQISEALKKHLK